MPAPTEVRWLTILGAAHNNLRDIDVRIPLGRFVCVTGVSGSGKSSLVNDILRERLARDLNGAETASPGRHRGILGAEHLDKVIDIDQTPIGRTPRSNPATYIKLFDEIRDLYAKLPDSKVRGYKPGRFSFNVAATGESGGRGGSRGGGGAGGRCEACEGNGSNRIEMDFLSDVWVPCPVCEGRRFNRDTLAVRFKGKSIADVLDLDVQEALAHFADVPAIAAGLRTLHDVGLNYLKLGQASTTLSGGEAQRIKLARELVKRSTGRTLYLLDEPTTGLHFEDVRRLLAVLHGFVDAGNTVIVIEHHLDVIKTADWVIDLGPDGGAGGGLLVAEGTPEQVAKHAESHTGAALRTVLPGWKANHRLEAGATNESGAKGECGRDGDAGSKPRQSKRNSKVSSAAPTIAPAAPTGVIRVVGAREHNLRDVTVDLPRNAITVCSGVSGSGKTSLAMDTVYTEGHRRYVESLSSYARQFLGQLQKPRVDHVHGLSPAIAIDQKTAQRSPRSTVGTVTEIYDYMRVLWARVGTAYCPKCDAPIGSQSADEIVEKVMRHAEGARLLLCAPVERIGGETYAGLFARHRAAGYARVRVNGRVHELAGDVPADDRRRHSVELVVDRVVVRQAQRGRIADSVEQCLSVGQGVLTVVAMGEDEGKVETSAKSERYSQHFSCDRCHTAYEELTPHHFSFNNRMGWCPACEGLGVQRGTGTDAFVTRPARSLLEGAVAGWEKAAERPMLAALIRSLAAHIGFDPATPWCELTEAQRHKLLFGTGEEWIEVMWHRLPAGAESPAESRRHDQGQGDRGEQTLRPGRTPQKRRANKISVGAQIESPAGSRRHKRDGAVSADGARCATFRVQFKGFFPAVNEATRVSWQYRLRLESLVTEVPCEACGGGRVRREAGAARLAGRTIVEVGRMPLDEAMAFFRGLSLDRRQKRIAGEVLREIESRLRFLLDVGLEYLSLLRAAPTLSGGEAQRIRLASQIGSGLTGVLYVLDEPTIGLHPRDNRRLIAALQKLRDLGNTLLMVEHDREVIEAADHVLDFGPGAGREGGRVVGDATPGKLPRQAESLTGKYLSGEVAIPVPTNRRGRPADGGAPDLRADGTPWDSSELTIVGARQNNLRNIDVTIPLNRFVCVTGVSGSGKSSLITDILHPALAQRIHRASGTVGAHDEVRGVERLDKVINVDQTPIGNSPLSSAVTYAGVFDLVREMFAKLPDSKVRGYTANRFSFNRPGGRCDACEGLGQVKHEMHFLPDVWVTCESCNGARFNRETLEVRYRGKNIADVLEMSAADALRHFDAIPRIKRLLQTLVDVGLDYLPLGQAAPTLSGGEAQRVKLAAELGRPQTGRTIYVLDEPTTGLHFEDLRKLLDVLHRLVDLGNSVVCIEHNLDVIKTADWVIDMGPEAGDAGGRVVAAGTPEQIASSPASHTGRALAPVLSAGPRAPRPRFDPRKPAVETLVKASHAVLESGGVDDARMPWERDGRRWHLHERPSRNGEKVEWKGEVLEFVADTLETLGRGKLAPIDWSERACVELRAAGRAPAKFSGRLWFMHALTGGRWLLELSFRVPRDSFEPEQLRKQLALKTLDEREDLPVYGNEPRVQIRPVAGDLDNVRVLVHDKPEVASAGFRRFLADALRAHLSLIESGDDKSADAAPWKTDGRGWHFGQKAVPPGGRTLWSPSTLIDLLGRMGRAAPGLKPDFGDRTKIALHGSNGRVVGRVWTNSRNGLRCELYPPADSHSPAALQPLGDDMELRRGQPDGADTILFWVRTGQDARNELITALVRSCFGDRIAAKKPPRARAPVATSE